MRRARRFTQVGGAVVFALFASTLSACKSSPAADTGPTSRPDQQMTTQTPSPPLRGTVYTSTERYAVVYEISPNPIPLNEMFSIDVQVMDQESMGRAIDVELSVDGRMPEHRHGMNVDPIVTSAGPGAFRVEGMLFHMVGRWEIHFDLTKNGMTERAWMEVFLE